MAFVFLLAVLGVVAPFILIASRTESARRVASTLILTAGLAGCLVAVSSLLRQPAPGLDLSWVTPFLFRWPLTV